MTAFRTSPFSLPICRANALAAAIAVPMLGLTLLLPGMANSQQTLPDGAIALVNGNPIPNDAHQAVVRQLRQNGQQPDAEQILDELINLELLTQKAESEQLHQRPEIQALLRLQYIQTMAQTYMGRLGEDIEITEADLMLEYDRQTREMAVAEYRARHILVDSRASGVELIAALENGADFATLARANSSDATSENGGDLGWFQTDSMDENFADAIKQLAVGNFSREPVETEFGWHIIRLDDKRQTNLPAFNDIRDELRNILLRERLTQRINQLRADASIQRR